MKPENFVAVIRELGCECSPGVAGTDTGWWTNPKCALHGIGEPPEAHEGEGDPRGWRDAVNPNP